ncbi:MAG: erythromycin esterase family protein [Rhodospirillaceae bacterium]|nr:erythromycin esterase family protein [Rhodospirillaceae bacterium]
MTKLDHIQLRHGLITPQSSSRSRVTAPDLDRILHRVADARIVVLEEPADARAALRARRAHITRRLITEHGFNVVAVDSDWPDAARVDHYVRHAAYRAATPSPFTRGPVRLWRTAETRGAMDWLRGHNAGLNLAARIAVHGLDLYSHARAAHLALSHLKHHDRTAAAMARKRFTQLDQQTYERLPLKLGIHEYSVLSALTAHLAQMRCAAEHDSTRFLDPADSARLIENAGSMYRAMYYGLPECAAARDAHMLETLQTLLRYYGPDSKVIVWAQSNMQSEQPTLSTLCAEAYGDMARRVSAAA